MIGKSLPGSRFVTIVRGLFCKTMAVSTYIFDFGQELAYPLYRGVFYRGVLTFKHRNPQLSMWMV